MILVCILAFKSMFLGGISNKEFLVAYVLIVLLIKVYTTFADFNYSPQFESDDSDECLDDGKINA